MTINPPQGLSFSRAPLIMTMDQMSIIACRPLIQPTGLTTRLLNNHYLKPGHPQHNERRCAQANAQDLDLQKYFGENLENDSFHYFRIPASEEAYFVSHWISHHITFCKLARGHDGTVICRVNVLNLSDIASPDIAASGLYTPSERSVHWKLLHDD
ncbi:hypothetical protein CC78DRAFT_575054 [Lojkania enalia]|uniref:Uncharacterized protein n=1 Tax=Lojkania enalia TaxID=147567 RepID=A0A9P4NA91_9PLEO|nr:hypothetical protein CC78DRAFT_575054 [Didymosphaeria enalia]